MRCHPLCPNPLSACIGCGFCPTRARARTRAPAAGRRRSGHVARDGTRNRAWHDGRFQGPSGAGSPKSDIVWTRRPLLRPLYADHLTSLARVRPPASSPPSVSRCGVQRPVACGLWRPVTHNPYTLTNARGYSDGHSSSLLLSAVSGTPHVG